LYRTQSYLVRFFKCKNYISVQSTGTAATGLRLYQPPPRVITTRHRQLSLHAAKAWRDGKTDRVERAPSAGDDISFVRPLRRKNVRRRNIYTHTHTHIRHTPTHTHTHTTHRTTNLAVRVFAIRFFCLFCV